MCPSLLQVDIIRCVHIASMTSNYNSVQTASAGRLFAKKSPQKVFGQISGGVARTSCDSALAKLVCDSGMQSKELSQGQVSDIGRSECWSDRARVFVNLSHFRSHACSTSWCFAQHSDTPAFARSSTRRPGHPGFHFPLPAALRYPSRR